MGETAKMKREAFDAFREKVHRQDGIYEENKIHLRISVKSAKRDRGAQEKIRRLESNILCSRRVENARNKIQRGLENRYPDRGPHFCRIGPGGDRSGVEKGG